MSEFECAKGHLIRPSIGYCEVCGGRAVRMDGKTAKQLEAEDRAYYEEIEKEERNEELHAQN